MTKLKLNDYLVYNFQRYLVWSIGPTQVVLFSLDSRNYITVNKTSLKA